MHRNVGRAARTNFFEVMLRRRYLSSCKEELRKFCCTPTVGWLYVLRTYIYLTICRRRTFHTYRSDRSRSRSSTSSHIFRLKCFLEWRGRSLSPKIIGISIFCCKIFSLPCSYKLWDLFIVQHLLCFLQSQFFGAKHRAPQVRSSEKKRGVPVPCIACAVIRSCADLVQDSVVWYRSHPGNMPYKR